MNVALARRLPRRAATVVALVSCVSYFVIARVVLILFPFSTFSMYAGGDGRGHYEACQLLAVGPDERGLDPGRFRAWSCPPWQDAAQRTLDESRCAAHWANIREVAAELESNAGSDPAAVSVQLVRRLWTFEGDAPATWRDLPVASCLAVPR